MEVDLIAPKIPYRETITKMAASSYRHKNNPEVPDSLEKYIVLIETVC
jgi:hypothetical protein